MKLLKAYIAIFSLATPSILLAESNSCVVEKPSSTCPEIPACPCPPSPALGGDVPCARGVTFEAGPSVCNGWNVFVTADFLYWTAKEDGLAYASTGSATAGAVADVPKRGSVRHPKMDWEPGFKVGLGWNMPIDGWDLFSQYTRFSTSNGTDQSVDPSNPNNQLVNFWGIGGSGIGNATNLPPNQSTNSAESKWNLDYNVVDLELGRNGYIGRKLAIRPSFGLRGTWQNQDYKVAYVTPPLGGPGDFVEWEMKQNLDMWAIGLRTAMNTSWEFNRYFSLVFNGAFSVLMTHFEITRKDSQKAFNDPNVLLSDLDLFHSTNDYYTLKPVVDFFIGLRGDYWMQNERFHIRLEAGWEESLWISQNNFFRLEENAHGDLALHGLTVKLRADF